MSTEPLLTDNSYIEVPIISREIQIIPPYRSPFPCCCCVDDRNNITNEHYKSYRTFLQICEESFDKTNPRHQKLLKDLEEEGKEIMERVKPSNTTSVWRFLGFQTENPETDFRAGGFLSLEFMLYALRQNALTDIELTLPFFFFALTCIKILYNVKIFLYLFEPGSMKVFINSPKYTKANRHQIKKFCLLDGFERGFFLELLTSILKHIYRRFKLEISYQKEYENYAIIEPLIEGSMVIFLFLFIPFILFFI